MSDPLHAKIEKTKLEAQLLRVESNLKDMEVKKMEMLQSIQRVDDQIKIQQETMDRLKLQLGGENG